MARTKQRPVEEIIQETVRTAIREMPTLPCIAEKARIDAIEELSRRLALIITGNGNPENGLVMKQDRTLTEVKAIAEKERERSKMERALLMVGIGLIATSVWQILVP